jgi:hypothetical protein
MRFLNAKCVLALGATLVAALLLPRSPDQSPRGRPPLDTRGWTLTDFVGHLRQRGVDLRVVPGTSDGSHHTHVYLTEDPGATWATVQLKRQVVECIHEWRGTVRVWHVVPGLEESVAEWGPYGCRIGRFLLFGDEAILRRILDACRS